MGLQPGARVGVYEVIALLGRGGMGEVYRARDHRLGRDVALKVLPEAFARDAERVARFEREAHLLAALNHPNIGGIYGVEEHDAAPTLVLELIDGPTLADRIARGALRCDEAIAIAKQIAEALETAHSHGIVHRDLKPANIKVRPDGAIKVLDFGLAKAAAAPASIDGLSNSPTVSLDNLTHVGLILGTAAYMAPEQARGLAVDKRADVWAFGCILYEMLTGRRAFDGGDVSQTLARVLERDPDWHALPASVPPTVRAFMQQCLAKDPARRTRDIGDVRLALDGAFSRPIADTGTSGPIWQRGLPWALGLAAGVIIGSAMMQMRDVTPDAVVRFEVPLPEFGALPGRIANLSPDGHSLYYVARLATGTRIMKRDLAGLRWTAVPGTEGASNAPFFPPGGHSIGFVADGERAIRTVPVDGGPSTLVVRTAAAIYSPVWLPDDTIVFGSIGGLWRIPATGGTAESLVKTNVLTAGAHALPGGKHLAFHALYGARVTEASIEVLTLATGERRKIAEGMYPMYAAGQLIFVRADNSVWRQPFDAGRAEPSGSPVRMPLNVFRRLGDVPFAVAGNRTLMFVPGEASGSRLTWVDAVGNGTPAEMPSADYSFPRISPDGTKLSIGIGNEIWVVDLKRSTRTKIASSDRAGFRTLVPITSWTPDSLRLTFNRGSRDTATRDASTLEWQVADAATPAEVLYQSRGILVPGSWTGDGKALMIMSADGPARDLWVLQRSAANQAAPWLVTPAFERAPALSPNGRWVAYVSDESGQDQVYLQSYPSPGKRHTVSADGGSEPVWARDGRELYYRTGDKMAAVAVDYRPALTLGPARVLFNRPYQQDSSTARGLPNYDVAGDGRFLMIAPSSPEHVVIVLNWDEELNVGK